MSSYKVWNGNPYMRHETAIFFKKKSNLVSFVVNHMQESKVMYVGHVLL